MFRITFWQSESTNYGWLFWVSGSWLRQNWKQALDEKIVQRTSRPRHSQMARAIGELRSFILWCSMNYSAAQMVIILGKSINGSSNCHLRELFNKSWSLDLRIFVILAALDHRMLVNWLKWLWIKMGIVRHTMFYSIGLLYYRIWKFDERAQVPIYIGQEDISRAFTSSPHISGLYWGPAVHTILAMQWQINIFISVSLQ